MKESTRVLVALTVGIVAGLTISASGSATLQSAADAVAPVGTLWVNAIRMTVIPLVVSLLITGVASVSDARSIGKLGGRTFLVFGALLAATAAVTIPLAAWVFSVLPNDPSLRPSLPAGAMEAASQLVAGGQAQTGSAWLVSLVPSNPIAAAASGAMLPLIIFTLFFALAIAQGKSETRDMLVRFFGAVADTMLMLERWIVLAAPVGVFALVLPLATHAGAQLVGAIGFYIAAYSAGCLVVILMLYPAVAAFGGVPMRRYARAALPAQLIAVSSSSSIASLPALVESADALAMPKSVTGFVLPLAVSTFKIASPVSWSIGALFVGWFYGVPVEARELTIIAFAAVFLAFGVPGVPRGAFIMLAPLFTAIGLPVQGIGILIAVDAIPDTIATALNVSGDLAAAAIVAHGDGPS